jgi:hypothetical protein
MRVCVLEEERDCEEAERTKLCMYDHFLIELVYLRIPACGLEKADIVMGT